jgi:hypothetical protein
MHRLVAGALGAVLFLRVLPAGAQMPESERWRPHEGSMLGIELSVLEPRGDFRPGHRAAIGYGLRGAVGWGPRGAFDIGLAYRSIAHDSRAYNDTIDVKNMLRSLAASARYSPPLRYLRPYVGASAGLAYLGTETFQDRCCDEYGERERVFDGVELASLVPMVSTRFGVLVDLWSMLGPNASTLAADLGIETHYGGRAAYQIGGRGDVRETGTSYRIYSLGISVRTR